MGNMLMQLNGFVSKLLRILCFLAQSNAHQNITKLSVSKLNANQLFIKQLQQPILNAVIISLFFFSYGQFTRFHLCALFFLLTFYWKIYIYNFYFMVFYQTCIYDKFFRRVKLISNKEEKKNDSTFTPTRNRQKEKICERKPKINCWIFE